MASFLRKLWHLVLFLCNEAGSCSLFDEFTKVPICTSSICLPVSTDKRLSPEIKVRYWNKWHKYDINTCHLRSVFKFSMFWNTWIKQRILRNGETTTFYEPFWNPNSWLQDKRLALLKNLNSKMVRTKYGNWTTSRQHTIWLLNKWCNIFHCFCNIWHLKRAVLMGLFNRTYMCVIDLYSYSLISDGRK